MALTRKKATTIALDVEADGLLSRAARERGGSRSEFIRQQLALVRPEGDELHGKLREGLRQVKASTGEGGVCTVVEVAPWSRIPEHRALLVARDD